MVLPVTTTLFKHEIFHGLTLCWHLHLYLICEQQRNILHGFHTLQYSSTGATERSTIHVSAYLVSLKQQICIAVIDRYTIKITGKLYLGLYWSVKICTSHEAEIETLQICLKMVITAIQKMGKWYETCLTMMHKNLKLFDVVYV